MASFYFNPSSGEKFHSQWNRHLQNKTYINDIKTAIRNNVDSYNKIANQSSELIVSTIHHDSMRQYESEINSTTGIIGAIDQLSSETSKAFESLTDKLVNAIEDLSSLFDWRMSQMIDQQRITNLLMNNVVLLLRIPDFQKERQYYIEQGFKHYKNAQSNPDLMKDAIENLIKAENLEPSDYIVLHRIGMIMLYQSKFLDIGKAEEYFIKAAKYSTAEIDGESSSALNVLSGDVSEDLKKGMFKSFEIKKFAAESYFQAGIACYLQGKISNAVVYSQNAYNINPCLLEAQFNIAKFLAAKGESEKSILYLNDLLKTDKLYAAKIAEDIDLATKPKIKSFLDELRTDILKQASQQLNKYKNEMVTQSKARSYLSNIEAIILQNTYFAGINALNELNKVRNWTIKIVSPEFILDESITGDPILAQSVVFSPDGDIIASTDRGRIGKVIKLWDIMSGRHVQTLLDHYVETMSFSFSMNGKIFASVTHEGEIILRDVISGQKISTLTDNDGKVGSIAFGPDDEIIVSGNNEGMIKFWDFKNRQEVFTITNLCSFVDPIIFSPNGEMFASKGDTDGSIKIWDFSSKKLIASLVGHKGYRSALSFSSDNKLLVSGGSDKEIKIWDIQHEKEILTIKGQSEIIQCLAFIPFEQKIVSSGERDGSIRLWDVQTGQLNKTYYTNRYRSGKILSFAFSPDGSMLAFAGNGLQLIDFKSGNEIREFIGVGDNVKNVASSPEGILLGSKALNKTIMDWGKEIVEEEYSLSIGEFIAVEKKSLMAIDEFINRKH